MFRLLLILSVWSEIQLIETKQYLGEELGELSTLNHGVRGKIYLLDENRIFIKGFSYDGRAPDAFFWIDTKSAQPNSEGLLVPYPTGSGNTKVLKKYDQEDVVLELPDNIKSDQVKWLSVWCRQYEIDFGHLIFPANAIAPRPRTIAPMSQLAHGVRSGPVVLVDVKSILLPNFYYDGAGPDAHFWVGNGSEPSVNGIKVPNERGNYDVLGSYSGQDIILTLPGNLTLLDIDWFSVWCVTFKHNFGSIQLPDDLTNLPPHIGPVTHHSVERNNKHEFQDISNCRAFLDRKLQVRWTSDETHAYIQLTSRLGTKQWFAFGVSGDEKRAQMIGADVIVAYRDPNTGMYIANDYYFTAKSQCSGGEGVCRDVQQNGENNVEVVSGDYSDGLTTIIFKRPLASTEDRDRSIAPFGDVEVILAMGNLNSANDPNYHGKDFAGGRLNFGSVNQNSCGGFSEETSTTKSQVTPWKAVEINGVQQFKAQIGPTGGARGYAAITGRPSWGIAWWINGLLIPELHVVRGKTYTFSVEGGDDPSNPAKYHPMYITESSEGGFLTKNTTARASERVYAGIDNVSKLPTAVGRLCQLKPKDPDSADSASSIEEFSRSLSLECSSGQPATLKWMVKEDTPDTVYYQCATHRNLGWKISVSSNAHSNTCHSGPIALWLTATALLVTQCFLLS